MCLSVDQTGEELDTTLTSETTHGGLHDGALDVVAQDLVVTLHTVLSETLSQSQRL